MQSLVSTKKNLGKQFAPDKWDYGHTDRILWPNLEPEPLYILFYKEVAGTQSPLKKQLTNTKKIVLPWITHVYEEYAEHRKQKGHLTKNWGKEDSQTSNLFVIWETLICLNTRNMEEEKYVPVFH